MKPESMDAIFQALAHQARRRILDIVRDSPGCNVNDVCAYFDMSRIAVMKHLRVLEDAELLISKKQGRERSLYFNAVPIQLIHDRWSSDYGRFWAERLMDIKVRVESSAKAAQAAPSKDVGLKAAAQRDSTASRKRKRVKKGQ